MDTVHEGFILESNWITGCFQNFEIPKHSGPNFLKIWTVKIKSIYSTGSDFRSPTLSNTQLPEPKQKPTTPKKPPVLSLIPKKNWGNSSSTQIPCLTRSQVNNTNHNSSSPTISSFLPKPSANRPGPKDQPPKVPLPVATNPPIQPNSSSSKTNIRVASLQQPKNLNSGFHSYCPNNDLRLAKFLPPSQNRITPI